VEEEVRSVGFERQVTELDNQELWLGETRQSILQAALAMRLSHRSHERRCSDKLHGVAGKDCVSTERY